MWNSAFSKRTSAPVRTAFHLKQDYGTIDGAMQGKGSGKDGKEYRVCFKDLAIGIYGPAAPITVASWNTPCHNTALVRGYADFIIRGMGLQGFTHYAHPKPPKTVVITCVCQWTCGRLYLLLLRPKLS